MTSKNEDLKSINWSVIPVLVIEGICIHLHMRDKRNMSLVCKNWWKAMLQVLWEYFKLNLFNSSLTTESWPVLELANKYGHMFRHVTISTIVSSKHAPKLCIKLKMFFKAISSKTQLVSFKLEHLIKLNETENENVFPCILSFIKTQHKLENVSLNRIYLNNEDGLEILNTLCNNCHNLKTLQLKEFLKGTNNYATNPNSHQIYKNLALKFINLQKLVMDYSKMFENIFSSFQDLEYDTRLPSRLLKIEMSYDGINMSYCEGIPPIAWKVLHELCPDLKVNVEISYPIFKSVEMYLIKFMPVTKLSIAGKYISQSNFDNLLQRIISTEIANLVEFVDISCLSQVGDISILLMPFFNACSKLSSCFIKIDKEASRLEDLFKSLLNNHNPNLKYLTIHISSVNSEDCRRYYYLSAAYRPVFGAIGLTLFLNAFM